MGRSGESVALTELKKNTDYLVEIQTGAELIITATEPALCTRAPTAGVRMPAIARKFSAMEKLMLHLIVSIIRLDRAIRCGSSFTLSSTSAMSAASTAISLPAQHQSPHSLFSRRFPL